MVPYWYLLVMSVCEVPVRAGYYILSSDGTNVNELIWREFSTNAIVLYAAVIEICCFFALEFVTLGRSLDSSPFGIHSLGQYISA